MCKTNFLTLECSIDRQQPRSNDHYKTDRSNLGTCVCMCVCGCCVLPNVEVLHIDILVGSGLPLAPQEKTLLCRGLCREQVEEKKHKKQ